MIVLLNAEWDHPDVFEDEAAVLDAFEAWIRRAPGATLVANVADRGRCAQSSTACGDWPGQIVAAPAAVPDGWRDRAARAGQRRQRAGGDRRGARPGRRRAAIRESLAEYRGVGRRHGGQGRGRRRRRCIDDYGHHPTAIARTLEAVRERYPDRRVWAVYEPLTYHRTAQMLEQFADVLATADEVAIADIWAGRDHRHDAHQRRGAGRCRERRSAGPARPRPGTVEATADYLAERVQPGDVVLVMGGGRSYVIAERLVTLLDAAR